MIVILTSERRETPGEGPQFSGCAVAFRSRGRAVKNVMGGWGGPNIPGAAFSDLLRCLAHATCVCWQSRALTGRPPPGVGGETLPAPRVCMRRCVLMHTGARLAAFYSLRVGTASSITLPVRGRLRLAFASLPSSLEFPAELKPRRVLRCRSRSTPARRRLWITGRVASCPVSVWLLHPLLLHRPLHKPLPSQFMCSARTGNWAAVTLARLFVCKLSFEKNSLAFCAKVNVAAQIQTPRL